MNDAEVTGKRVVRSIRRRHKFGRTAPEKMRNSMWVTMFL
jgi:hypothetical protein